MRIRYVVLVAERQLDAVRLSFRTESLIRQRFVWKTTPKEAIWRDRLSLRLQNSPARVQKRCAALSETFGQLGPRLILTKLLDVKKQRCLFCSNVEA